MAAAVRARLALVLDRAAHLVAARQAVDVGAVLGQRASSMVKSSSCSATTWMTPDSDCTRPVTTT